MYVAAITAFLGVAAAAPLPTTWPAPHNTSTQCVHMLAKHKLDRLESDLARCIEYGSTCPTREEARTAFANNERAVLSVPKSRRHIMNISDLSSIHAGPLAEFLGKEWRWGNPDKPIPHKAVYYASRACLGGNHPRHWVPRVH